MMVLSCLEGMLIAFVVILADIKNHGKKCNYNCVLCDLYYCPSKYCWNKYKELNNKDKE